MMRTCRRPWGTQRFAMAGSCYCSWTGRSKQNAQELGSPGWNWNCHEPGAMEKIKCQFEIKDKQGDETPCLFFFFPTPQSLASPALGETQSDVGWLVSKARKQRLQAPGASVT